MLPSEHSTQRCHPYLCFLALILGILDAYIPNLIHRHISLDTKAHTVLQVLISLQAELGRERAEIEAACAIWLETQACSELSVMNQLHATWSRKAHSC